MFDIKSIYSKSSDLIAFYPLQVLILGTMALVVTLCKFTFTVYYKQMFSQIVWEDNWAQKLIQRQYRRFWDFKNLPDFSKISEIFPGFARILHELFDIVDRISKFPKVIKIL